ncbi:MAG: 16S rRNA (adenine(1518)-N(6)/adenine(1519)-N(6))-dimethyltransferase RsmA [Solirubrobacteraceae bacterium]
MSAAAAMADPRQPSLRRLRRFEIRPDRDLGQNFLIDSNILEVIGRAAELAGDDIVLEIGGGLGVLSEYLAARVGYVHVVEIDRRLEPALLDALEPFSNVTLHWGDAMRVDLADMRPQPTKVVANLPYGIAAGVLLRTIEQLPEVRLWVAMVQREVAQRLAAGPGGGEYGVSSVIAQLACEVQMLRAIPRTVFHPVPNVDSALVRMVRRREAPPPALAVLVRAAFAHRRKALARSVSIAGAGGPVSRERVLEALGAMGLQSDVRAERLSAEQFRELGKLLGV